MKKLIMLVSLRLKYFYQILLIVINLDVGFGTLDENFNFCDKKKRELILFVRLLWSVN
jgi:hypothetical protein